MSLHTVISQGQYAQYLAETKEWTREFVGKCAAYDQEQFNKLSQEREPYRDDGNTRDPKRDAYAKALLKGRAAEIHGENGENRFVKAGVTSALGYNFYDLRAPVQLSYPVNTPFRNEMPRTGRVNDGFGTAAHWMATRNPGTEYAGVAEGQRNAIASPDQNSYTATYKEIGIERAVTFTAQVAGEGFADNVADEHLRGFHELALQEEGMILMGNSGTGSGNNGYQFGQAPTPVVGAPTVGGAIGSGLTVSVAVVAISPLGFPNNLQYGYGNTHTVLGGLIPSRTRNNQDGTSVTVNGGTSQISAITSAASATTSPNQTVAASCASVPGASAYAWYVSTNGSPTLANSFLYAITSSPNVSITAAPGATQAGNATGLNSDHSFNSLEFDGLLTYVIKNIGLGAFYSDLAGGSLTSGKDGTVDEIEAALLDRWTQHQAGVNAIWCGSQARITLDKAIKWGGTNGQPFRVEVTRDQQGNMVGGFLVGSYLSKWSMNTGAQSIPIYTHPMLPSGAIYFDIKDNPYPHSRIAGVREMLVQRDYYSIEWPLVTRQWVWGTYVHEVLRHNLPWISGLITGVGPFVGN